MTIQLQLTLVATALALSLSACADSEAVGDANEPVVAAIGDQSRPLYYRDDDGELAGLVIDLVEEIEDRSGIEFELEVTDFANMIPGLQSGNYDVALNASDITQERRDVIDFVSWWKSDNRLLTRVEGAGEVDASMDALCGLKLSTLLGQTHTQAALEEQSTECEEAGMPPIVLSEFPDTTKVRLAVKSGRVDAAVTDSVLGADLQKTEKGWLVTGPDYAHAVRGMMFANGSELAPKVQAVLAELLADGTYDALLEAHGLKQIMNLEKPEVVE